jgi:hypothetical protein
MTFPGERHFTRNKWAFDVRGLGVTPFGRPSHVSPQPESHLKSFIAALCGLNRSHSSRRFTDAPSCATCRAACQAVSRFGVFRNVMAVSPVVQLLIDRRDG